MLYNKTDIVNYFTVKSIVTIYNLDLKELTTQGESHDFWELVYVESGSLRLLLDGRETLVGQGEAIFYAPNVHHGNVDDAHNNDAKVKIVSFICEPKEIDCIKDKVIRPEHEEVQLINRIIAEGIEYFDDIRASDVHGMRLKEGVSPGRLQALKNRLEILLIKIFEREYQKQHKTPVDYKMSVAESISDYLAKNLTSKLTLSQIASHMNLSVSSIKQIFRENFGGGIIEYFINLKIDKAKELIETSSLNFSQIANYLSFESVHYFSRAFKKRTGLTPSEYKLQCKNKLQ